jgi:hypothetical protein
VLLGHTNCVCAFWEKIFFNFCANFLLTKLLGCGILGIRPALAQRGPAKPIKKGVHFMNPKAHPIIIIGIIVANRKIIP